MIAGAVILEDTMIEFSNDEEGNIEFTVTDSLTRQVETKIVSQPTFLKALAIAVHNDGMPDYKVDYDAAESIMGSIRWIP